MFIHIHNLKDRKILLIKTKTDYFRYDFLTDTLEPYVFKNTGSHIFINIEPSDLKAFLKRVFSPNFGEIYNNNHGLTTLPRVSPRLSLYPVFYHILSDDSMFTNVNDDMIIPYSSSFDYDKKDVRTITLTKNIGAIKTAIVGRQGVGKTYLTTKMFNPHDVFETDCCSKDTFNECYSGQKFIVIGCRDMTFDLDYVKQQLNNQPINVIKIA